ncbi:uncharacterized protein LOC128263363 [Drosophila gunungcola]|uniref:uncharacterized protein LOC128263363 n=1 Tax=Drosophila gunungcola TaxID=103775 RepID=UPI0022E2FDD2|nr:uncharacterized protein LOC128263363 [Drosophila gunungcola]
MLRILLILAVGGTSIRAARYKLEFEDPNIFSPCIDGPPGSIGIPDAFNMDNMVFDLDEEGVHVSGNLTTKWNFPRTDRISSEVHIMYLNRGTWESTIFNMHTPDFCAAIFNENLYWFKYWFKNIENREEIQEKCVATKDTVLKLYPFVLNLILENIRIPVSLGRYKTVFTLEAFDESEKRRPTSLCFEIKGQAAKMKD